MQSASNPTHPHLPRLCNKDGAFFCLIGVNMKGLPLPWDTEASQPEDVRRKGRQIAAINILAPQHKKKKASQRSPTLRSLSRGFHYFVTLHGFAYLLRANSSFLSASASSSNAWSAFLVSSGNGILGLPFSIISIALS